jgi:excisionase family DNA binding protein
MTNDTLLVRPSQAVKIAGCPRAMIYEALHSGELPHIKRGARFYIGRAALERWVESLGERKVAT